MLGIARREVKREGVGARGAGLGTREIRPAVRTRRFGSRVPLYTPRLPVNQLSTGVENAVEKRARISMMEVWSSILKGLEGKLDAKELKTWFAPTRQVALEERGSARSLTVAVPNRVFAEWITSRHGALLSREAAAVGFPGLSIRFESAAPEPAPAPAPVPPQTAPPTVRGLILNPRFTFDTFVVGASNQFAHAAARAVAESPSRAYNPLFLYGGVGLGKTHLMHAVAREVGGRSSGT